MNKVLQVAQIQWNLLIEKANKNLKSMKIKQGNSNMILYYISFKNPKIDWKDSSLMILQNNKPLIIKAKIHETCINQEK